MPGEYHLAKCLMGPCRTVGASLPPGWGRYWLSLWDGDSSVPSLGGKQGSRTWWEGSWDSMGRKQDLRAAVQVVLFRSDTTWMWESLCSCTAAKVLGCWGKSLSRILSASSVKVSSMKYCFGVTNDERVKTVYVYLFHHSKIGLPITTFLRFWLFWWVSSFRPTTCSWLCLPLCADACSCSRHCSGAPTKNPQHNSKETLLRNKARQIHMEDLLNLASYLWEKWLVNRFICHKFLAEWFLQIIFGCKPFANTFYLKWRFEMICCRLHEKFLGWMNITPWIRFLVGILVCIKSVFTFWDSL